MGSLFAGIGGFDLGFERAGFDVVWQVEIDPYCRKVLARHFAKAERFEDVRECGKYNLRPVDVICGGFPCQDISVAGKRAGIDGERSGLWREYARIIGELRPRFVVVENVAALLGRGMGRVLGDLSEIGYDAEWQVISAADMGAPHLRERVWIVAYDSQLGCGQGRTRGFNSSREGESERPLQDVADTTQFLCGGNDGRKEPSFGLAGRSALAYANGNGHDRPQWDEAQPSGDGADDWISLGNGQVLADSSSLRRAGPGESIFWSGSAKAGKTQANHAFAVSVRGQWSIEPNVGRVAHGVPARVDRLRGLGNSVVSQIPEMIARTLKRFLEVPA